MRKLEVSEPLTIINNKEHFQVAYISEINGIPYIGAHACLDVFTHSVDITQSFPRHSKQHSDSLHSFPRPMRCVFQLGCLLNR